jgi:hypothetical protein
MNIATGSRWKSAVCATEVVVVKAPTAAGELACGGTPMLAMAAQKAEGGAPAAGKDAGTKLGKRYGDAGSALEVLCTKGGAGSLSFADRIMEELATKRLPSSD